MLNFKEKKLAYENLLKSLSAMIENETDIISVMSTVACELQHAFSYVSWTGFYRDVGGKLLKVGPYQGEHGCLTIRFDQGVCGRAASLGKTQIVHDVTEDRDHIACSSATRSEIVVPVFSQNGKLCAVLDLDSPELAAFDEIDQEFLEKIATLVGGKYD